MTIPQALDLAIQHHRAGRLADAEALYRQILAAQPQHPQALHLLGLIAHQSGRHDLAVALIQQAIALHPNFPDAHCDLGEVWRATGRFDEAVGAFRRAIELQPVNPKAHNNLGAALAGSGKFDEATAEFRRALELNPDFPEALKNLGIALRRQGEFEQAIAAYRRAIQLQPDYPEALNNLGIAFGGRGELDEAVVSYRRALDLRPNYPEAAYNLGAALAARGEPHEAIAAYHRALELNPNYAGAINNLGTVLAGLGRLDEAMAAYLRALDLEPDFPEPHNNLGNAFKDQGRLDEALAAYRRAFQVDPDYVWAHSNLIHALHYHPGYDARMISEEHERWNIQFGDPLRGSVPRFAHVRDPERRLRIGYVSPDFRDHPVGRYLLPLFENYDRQRFEVLCYSGVARHDWLTERLRARAAEWRKVVGISDARLAEIIREDEVDILVDLSSHTGDHRLPVFARQSAPVQVSWLAYPGSTGLRGIGYRLTDAHMDPPGEELAWSSEEPVRLPDCWCCYAPEGDYPEGHALPAFSAKGVTFGSLNNFAKVNDGVLALWARVLAAVEGSRLLMSCPEGRTRERVRAFFGARGIAEDRVELFGFAARWDYLSLYQRIDLALDPFPYNGMTTTCDALWMGAPVLILAGTMPASRAGLSILSNVGLAELAAKSEDDYLRLAVKLAGDLPRLADLRATLRARMQASPLMDAPRFARNVEAAYRTMWKRWVEKQSPEPQ